MTDDSTAVPMTPLEPRRILATAERLDAAGFPEIARPLSLVASTAGRTTLRTCVLGRFSVGKSTLINAFLGYPVLPGGLAPTTGVLCRLSYGPPGATVRFEDGRVEHFSGPEGLRPFVSLNPEDATADALIRSIVLVEVCLPLPLLENGLEIVDSPGLDEASARTSMAALGLDSADLVLFVLAADQPFSEIERVFLLEEVAPRDPGGAALIVNFWDRIPESDQDSVLERIQAGAAEVLERWRSIARRTPPQLLPVFPLSAGRALRSRWKPGRADAESTGIEALEGWLRAQAANRESIAADAMRGRTRFQASRAAARIDQEMADAAAALREERRALALTETRVSRERASLDAAVRLAAASGGSLKELLTARIAEAHGRYVEEVRRRLKRDPFDSLASLRAELAGWWRQVLGQISAEASSQIVRTAALLEDSGCSLSPTDLPPLSLTIPEPSLEFAAAADPGAPVVDTISGLLGSVSQGAGDAASQWMKKATRAASLRSVTRKAAASEAAESLEMSLSVAAYRGRESIGAWATALESAVRDMAARRRTSLGQELNRVQREVSAREARLELLSELSGELRDLAASAQARG